MWVGSFSSLSVLSTVDFFPVFPRVFSPGVVMGFDFTGLVVWLLLAPRSWEPHRRSSPFSRFVTFRRFCAMRVGVPPLFPRSLQRSLASCLAALPFASLPLVSRPWMVLSWSPLMSLSSVSDRFVVVPRQLVGLFAMRSPFRVTPVSVLGRNDGSYYTFLVSGRSLRDEVTFTGRVFLRSRSERRLFGIYPRVWCQAFVMGSPVSGRVAYVCALGRNEGFFHPSILRCFAMGSPYGSSVVFLPLDQNEVFFG